MKSLLTAIQFLTKIPVPVQLEEDDFTPLKMASTMSLFPLVGIFLGLLLILMDLLTSRLSPLLQNMLLLSLYTLLTGGLHLDGYMDTLDGLLPAVAPERRQEIMKDSNIGAFGAIGLVILLLLKLTLFFELPSEIRQVSILFMPLLSRFSMTAAAYLFKNRRREGLGYLFSQAFDGRRFFVSTLITFSIILFLEPVGLLLLPLMVMTTLCLGRWITGLIQGLTGDSYGFINEVNEVMVLLFISLGWSLFHGS